jgi:prepilin-type N-terminal cleavage/methylation domain-containing protein
MSGAHKRGVIHQRRSRLNRRVEGFTLIELVIVISILSLISVIAVPNLLDWRNSAKLRGAAGNLKGDMELAKLKAIQVNDSVLINFSQDSYTIFKDNVPTNGVYDAGEDLYGDRTLPTGVKIDLANTNFSGQDYARFKGRGTAAAGSVVLVDTRKAARTVSVSPLGKITIKSEN